MALSLPLSPLSIPRRPSGSRQKALDSPPSGRAYEGNVTPFPVQKTHTSPSAVVYSCPYSGQQYSGACPVSKCPANIRAKRHPSACLHNCFPDKELGVHELAFALGKDSNDLRQSYERGMESLKHLVLLERCLDWVRVRSVKEPVCACGAVIGHSSCTRRKCRNAQRLEKMLGRYPFTVEPLKVTAADLGRLFYWRSDLERVFKVDLLAVMNVSTSTYERYQSPSSPSSPSSST